jgi:hypothetical protein
MFKMTATAITLTPLGKYLAKAAESLIGHNSGWRGDFCDNCPRLRVYPASFYDPGDADCDAGLNPLNECCFRREELFENEDVYRDACELYVWDMD